MKKSLNILEVNNFDFAGRRFNGYDLIEYAKNNTNHHVYQFTKIKQSDNPNVFKYFDEETEAIEYKLTQQEEHELSMQGCLSLTSPYLYNSEQYKNADVVHYHMIHNTKLNLFSIMKSAVEKPTVISVHDFWVMTGRCVQPYDCTDWKTECKKCKYLNNYFILPEDNAKYLWKIKQMVFSNMDIDVVVASKYIYDCVKSSPMFKNCKNIHYIPFGLDLEKFKDHHTKAECRKKLGIPEDNIVLFLRSQEFFKGTDYVEKALKLLKTDKKITVLTCSQPGLLDSLKSRYQVVEVGYIYKDGEMIDCYQACDIFLNPSIGESFGMMTVEAMACERPVIVFNNTALPSVSFAPEVGVLVENRNAKKLMEAIKLLIEDDKERLRRGKLCRQKAEKEYDAHKYNERMMKLYEEVVNRKKSKKTIISDGKSDTANINAKLYRVTKNIFGYIPNEFKKLKLNDIEEIKSIDYADVNIQEFIVEYNNALYNYTKNPKHKHKDKNMVVRKAETFMYLLRTDKSKLKEVVKEKLRGKKNE